VPGDSLAAIEAALPEPTSVWQKLVPLAVIFFCAGFNLTLIQNASHSLMARRPRLPRAPCMRPAPPERTSTHAVAAYAPRERHAPACQRARCACGVPEAGASARGGWTASPAGARRPWSGRRYVW